MKTAEEMVEFVGALITEENAGKQTPLEATCWFIAYTEAQGLLGAWSTKDVARSIVSGDLIGGPYETLEHVQGWLDDQNDMGLADEHLKLQLRDFYRP